MNKIDNKTLSSSLNAYINNLFLKKRNIIVIKGRNKISNLAKVKILKKKTGVFLKQYKTSY